MAKKKVKFKELRVGAMFFETPDKYGRAFTFPFVKILPIKRGDTVFNAQAGKAYSYFEDNDEVY